MPQLICNRICGAPMVQRADIITTAAGLRHRQPFIDVGVNMQIIDNSLTSPYRTTKQRHAAIADAVWNVRNAVIEGRAKRMENDRTRRIDALIQQAVSLHGAISPAGKCKTLYDSVTMLCGRYLL